MSLFADGKIAVIV